MKTKGLSVVAIMLLGIGITSCTTIKNVGSLNMVSTRNIETTGKYTMIQKYVALTKKEIKKTKSETVQEAVDAIVKKVDGGEYLMNAKVYLIAHDHFFGGLTYNYAVEGDVWGKK